MSFGAQLLAGLSATLLAASMAPVPGPAVDPLSRYVWRARVLLIFAPSSEHPHAVRQREIIAGHHSGAAERDLVIVEAVGSTVEAEQLRRRFEVPGGEFRVMLIGKDGGVKHTEPHPISAAQLFDEIDEMPMRRQEMKR